MNTRAAPQGAAFQLTRFIKSDGPLTKRINLGDDGAVKSDGSACIMPRGYAEQVHISSAPELAALISGLEPHQAIALGSLRGDLPPSVQIVTKRKLEGLNSEAQPGIVARTADYIHYRAGQPAFALLDFDSKGMPPAVFDRMQELGGYWPALVSVMPELANVARVVRRSTSAGLFRSDTGERLPGSNGVHVYVAMQDGSDAERFLRTLHQRCWLHGFGWMMVGAGGQPLERSIVDRMVYAPERLVFEGGPVLVAPLMQDQDSRRPVATDGGMLDTATTCRPLSIVEQAKLRELRAREAQRLAPDSTKARTAFVVHQAAAIVARTGLTQDQAADIVARQCAGVLLPDVALPFDDPDFAGKTVADVLVDPAHFEGATLADPLEGAGYGPCKAIIMRRADGAPWIHSFAHGRTIYELRHDARAIAVAARNRNVADAQSRVVSGAHYLRLKRRSDARYLRLSARSVRRTRDRAFRRKMCETEGAAGQRSWWAVRPENGRFPGARARLTDRPRNPPEKPLRN